MELTKVTILEDGSESLIPQRGKWTIQQEEDALNLVLNKKNWKYPINAIIPKDSDMGLFTEAIINQCGCCPDFKILENGKIRVTAIGYYVAVGA